jgi:hypothetical protein
MKQYVVGGLAAALTAAALIAAAPPASAGCQSGRRFFDLSPSAMGSFSPTAPGNVASRLPRPHQHRREQLLYGLRPRHALR